MRLHVASVDPVYYGPVVVLFPGRLRGLRVSDELAVSLPLTLPLGGFLGTGYLLIVGR